MDEQSLFLQALDKTNGDERSAWLDEACGSDTPLRERIEALLLRHERANSFLERPAMELESIAGGTAGNDVAEGREAGVASADTSPEGVVMGSANHSVLKSLGRTLDVVPRVVLRDTTRQGGDPIVRPASKEVPDRNADSRYQMLGEIARGGMGAIIKGRDTDLGRDLAIKVLLESHKDKPEVIQRFVEEAQIGGQLQHPGIAPVYELGQFSDRRPFFSMKLVKGHTLSSLLAERDGPSVDRAKFLGIFEQVCQTMAYAHSRGVIHRDLKPANIMVGAFGEVQVMDWGLAKVLAEGGIADEKKAHETTQEKSIIQTLRSHGSDTPEGFGSETQMGSVMGTPAYMAPEQALGETDRLDERTDVFGLGAILCIILTGQPPYAGEDGTQIIRQAIRGKLEDCFARLDACGADADLVDLAKHCLEVEPSDRPRNAGVLAQRVSHYLESVETRLRETQIERAAQTARAEEERKRFRVTLALAASVLLLIGLAGGGWLWVGQQQAERRRVATNKVTEALTEAILHEGRADAAELEAQLQELDLAIKSAELAQDLAEQEDVEDTVRKDAKQLLTGLTEREETAQKLAAQARADRELQIALEDIRLGQADQGERVSSGGRYLFFDIASANERYEAALRKAGLDLLTLDVSEAAARIRDRDEELRETIIAGLDNWVRSLSYLPNTPDEQFIYFLRARDFVAAADVGLRIVEETPENSELWRRLAPVLLLAKGETAYREFCERMARQFAETDSVVTSERILKSCLLSPGAIELDQLQHPHSKLALLLDEGNAPDWYLPWLWFARGLFAYRSGDAESALEYARLSEEHNYDSSKSAQALNLALRALAQHQLGQTDKVRTNVEQAFMTVDGMLKGRHDPGNVDLLVAKILLREATELLKGNVSPELALFVGRALTNVAASSPQRLTRRERLLAVADEVDANPWRKRLRGSLKEPDIAALKELAASKETEETTRQSPELIAWLGAALREADEPGESVKVLKEAQQNDPGDFWLNCELATSLLTSGKATEAVEFARAAVAVKPNSLGSLLILQDALGEAGRNEDYYRVRHQTLPRLPLGREDARAMYKMGHSTRHLEQLDDLIALERGYTEAYPNDARGHLTLAMNLSNDGERMVETLAPLHRFIDLKPHDAPAYAWFAVYVGNSLTFQNKLEEAIDAYRLAIQFDPENALMWLRLAPALAMAGDQVAYGEYCREILNHFANTENVLDIEKVCRACLLMPDAIDLADLPHEKLAKTLDEGASERGFEPRGWSTRALVAYRSGDAEAALKFVQQSQNNRNKGGFVNALNLTILALAHQELGRSDQARNYATRAATAIENLKNGPARGNGLVYHDVHIPQVLLREADAQLNETLGQLDLFERSSMAGDFVTAAEVGRRLVEQDPSDSLMWLRLAPILVLAGDEAAYREHCQQMAAQFAQAEDYGHASKTCKTCLLLPGAVNLDQLPQEALVKSLGDGTALDWFIPWGWSTRALLAHRKGDADSAIQYVQQSEENNPNEFAHALNLTILTLAHQQLGQLDEARNIAATAAQAIDNLPKNKSSYHDVLIPQILLREAQSLISAKATLERAEGEDAKPSSPTPN